MLSSSEQHSSTCTSSMRDSYICTDACTARNSFLSSSILCLQLLILLCRNCSWTFVEFCGFSCVLRFLVCGTG